MSGSRLGRGRSGRLAVYVGCAVLLVLLVFLYRAATSEMARLRELHLQCAHQQEALAAQLQVIFEYKVRLEKSLAEEKSSNAVVKQELQQRASREKSLRDKDSIEAMQRFNSLQQTYKILHSEHRDLQEECEKRQKQALEDTKRLESTLQELRSRIKQAQEEKEQSLEHLKNKYLELETEKTKLERKYNETTKGIDSMDSKMKHLEKEVFQLKRELENEKRSCKATSTGPILASPKSLQMGQLKFQEEEQRLQLQQQNQVQRTFLSSTIKTIPAVKFESSTKSNGNLATTSSDKAPSAERIASKQKLPLGVVPVPLLIDQNIENRVEKREDEAKKKKDEEEKILSMKKSANPSENNKDKEEKIGEEEEEEEEDMEAPYPHLPPVRRANEQLARKREGAAWLKVRPGVQEIGDEPNHVGPLAGLDDANGDAIDDQYGPFEYDQQQQQQQQKNNDVHLVEGEDEAEDEDDQLDNGTN